MPSHSVRFPINFIGPQSYNAGRPGLKYQAVSLRTCLKTQHTERSLMSCRSYVILSHFQHVEDGD
ncbi:hypothetical protein SAMN02927900_05742 [Rhizobium mongolense subsp. loessense]|uniref:Uncharacterized protein n=1 Tax=Rhizobium mongolense subsp. loessense TaxID=158890 RepID=A0A1G4TYX8_9HYPH|nr:hypothetical protein SAMN02927900_05742 [Rhizobium mongolense subsp. loessense]